MTVQAGAEISLDFVNFTAANIGIINQIGNGKYSISREVTLDKTRMKNNNKTH